MRKQSTIDAYFFKKKSVLDLEVNAQSSVSNVETSSAETLK